MAGRLDKKYVVDSSFVLAFLLPSEKSKHVDEIFTRYKEGEIKLISSHLLPFEVGNGLKTALLRKRLRVKEVKILLRAFLDLEIELEEIDTEETFKLALSQNLTMYDAAYLFLATAKRIPLLTLDTDLKKN